LWVVKSQIHAGGRGKGKFKEARPATRAASAWPSRSTRLFQFAKEMLGATLVTEQTGPAGKQVNRLYHRRRRGHREGALSLDPGRP
jgi:succinyl-CoA synthetase beta subunit